jgi:general secretion pathway protein E/type IV pilus assembly protein PilB
MYLGTILLDQGLLTREQLDEAVREEQSSKEKLPQVLLRKGLVSEDDLCRVMSRQLSLPYVPLDESAVDPAALDKVPVKVIFDKRLIPITNGGDAVTVAVSDPFDMNTLDELRLLTGRSIRPVIARPSEIEKMIKKFYGVGGGEVDHMVSLKDGQGGGEDKAESGHDLEMAEDASLIKFVNQLMVEAVRDRASDIHVEPFEEELRIRNRIDGVLHKVPVPGTIKRFQNAIVSRLKIMAQLNIAEKRLPQDGRIKIKAAGREIDVRVSIIPGVFGEGVCLRLLDQEQTSYRMEDLGMPSDVYAEFGKVIQQPYGMFLVTGPTGSGKTTTLYAALAKINSVEDKIITIEDPVEYRLSGVKQIQVNPKVGLTFANGLRSILRHDPDIIMVGEIRDYETAEIAIQAALTGHLVFSTLHTNDAPSAVTRLVDMGVEPYLVASTVEGCMAQRLVRRICKSCRRPHDRSKGGDLVLAAMPKSIDLFYRGEGCESCRGTGYRGRIGLYELMPMDNDIRELVVSKESSARLKSTALKKGMKSLRDRGWEYVREGITTPEEVFRITKEDRF